MSPGRTQKKAVSPIPAKAPKKFETDEEARQRQREESVPQADEQPMVIALDTDEELEHHLDTAAGEGSTRTTEDRTAEDLRHELEDPNLIDIFGYVTDSDEEFAGEESREPEEESREVEESRETEDREGEGSSLQERRGESQKGEESSLRDEDTRVVRHRQEPLHSTGETSRRRQWTPPRPIERSPEGGPDAELPEGFADTT